jgi:hypothetical protein
MALLGWVPAGDELLPQASQPRFVHNASGRFESRYSALTVLKSKAVLLKGMEGSTLGVWVAHGEGQVHFPDKKVEKAVLANNQVRAPRTRPDSPRPPPRRLGRERTRPSRLAATDAPNAGRPPRTRTRRRPHALAGARSPTLPWRIVPPPAPMRARRRRCATPTTTTSRPRSTRSTPTARRTASPRSAPRTGGTWR